MKKIKWCMIVAFWMVMIGISGCSLLKKDRDFSENENRYLQQFPEFSWEKVKSGEFQEDLELYLNDQICFRDKWISAKTAIQKLAGKREIGGAYLGRDGYYFEKIAPEDVDDILFEKNVKAVSTYFENCRRYGIEKEKLCFLLVPTSGLVLSEQLPANARMFDQEKYMDELKQSMTDYHFIDVRQEMSANMDKQLYYRTDHHWTSDGAFVAYEKWCRETGHIFAGEDMYEKQQVTDCFRGSLYSKTLDCRSAYDAIWIYRKKDSESSFEIRMDGQITTTFYQEEKLEEKDKYAYFFGGNYGEIRISNKAGGQGNLLVIKDSFANSFVPLLAEQYENIYMIDLRYYKGDMQEYLQQQEITEVLVLYNISNFISDNNIFILGR